MSKPTLVDGSPVTTRSPLTSRSMNELAPVKSDTVPLTPEILNSVMAMTNPLEYSFSTNHSTSAANDSELLVIISCCHILFKLLSFCLFVNNSAHQKHAEQYKQTNSKETGHFVYTGRHDSIM